MKKGTWRKQHKWLGIGLSFFMLMFCVSGILLNHRSPIKDVNVSRKYLPSRYEFRNWNGGLLRGTLDIGKDLMVDSMRNVDSYRQLLLYGNGGIWLTDSKASYFKDFNEGLPEGADYRQIKNVIRLDNGRIFAVSPFGLYRYGVHNKWHKVNMSLEDEEKFTDIASHGDTVWLLHSGELFGITGKIVVDAIAIILVVLCITGIVFWLRPKRKALLQTSLHLHDRIGRYTIILALLIALTGWCLRPPVMIALVLSKIPSIPGTTLRSKNPWNDKLRIIRYDESCHDWLLSSSEGFYSLNIKNATVKVITSVPPVSVMGLNVLQKDANGRWLCGSFSGLFVWDRRQGTATDYFTNKPAPNEAGAPFGKKAVAGMSQDFSTPVVAEYYEGTNFAPQPSSMNQLPMSLWNVALEVHSGRIFIGTIATYIFIFVMGILAFWCLWSGYKIRLKKK